MDVVLFSGYQIQCFPTCNRKKCFFIAGAGPKLIAFLSWCWLMPLVSLCNMAFASINVQFEADFYIFVFMSKIFQVEMILHSACVKHATCNFCS